MKEFTFYFKNNFLRKFTYQASFWGYICLTCLFYFFQFQFIERIFDLKNDFGGLGSSGLYLIYFNFVILYLGIEFFSSSIHRFFEIVYMGGIEPFLTKPISSYKLILFGWCNPMSLILALIIGSFMLFGTNYLKISVPFFNWLGYLISMLCVFICNICTILGLNLFTFVIQRKLPVDYIHDRIFDLSIVPMNLFPGQILKFLVIGMPIAVSASLPASILLKSDFWTLPYLLFGTIAIVLAVIIGYSKLINKFDGIGG